MKDCCKKALEEKKDVCPDCGHDIRILQIRIKRLGGK